MQRIGPDDRRSVEELAVATSGGEPSPARLKPGKWVGWDVYGVSRGHLPTIQAGGGHPAADGGTCLDARLREGHISGLVGFLRPNHAQKAPTKKVVQLRCSCNPHHHPGSNRRKAERVPHVSPRKNRESM